jgi:hypothetical protein
MRRPGPELSIVKKASTELLFSFVCMAVVCPANSRANPPDGSRAGASTLYGVGDWYWIGVALGIGIGIGIAGGGIFGAGGPWLGVVLGAIAGAAVGVAVGFIVGDAPEIGAGAVGGILGAVAATPVVSGALRRGGTRGGLGAIVGAVGLIMAALALVPALGYVTAVAVPVIAFGLRRRGGGRYAGLRILARD